MDQEAGGSAAPEQLFVGEGDMPPDLESVNWGAAIFSLVWVVLWGMWAWVGVFAALVLLPALIEQIPLLLLDPVRDLPRWQSVINIVEFVVLMVVSIMLGLRANRIVWERERRRFEAAGGDPARPIPLRRYRRSLAFWRRLGFGLLALVLVIDVVALALGRVSAPRFLLSVPLGLVSVAVLFVLDQRRRRKTARS